MRRASLACAHARATIRVKASGGGWSARSGLHRLPVRRVTLLAAADVPWHGVLDLRDRASTEVFERKVKGETWMESWST